ELIPSPRNLDFESPLAPGVPKLSVLRLSICRLLSISFRCSVCLPGFAQGVALRHRPLSGQPPQGDQQLASQRHDCPLAHILAPALGLVAIPLGQRTVALELEKAPGELDHAAAYSAIAAARQAFFPPP